MSVVTVSAGTIGPEYHGEETSLKLRIYCRKTFTTTDLEVIAKGGVGSDNFYKEVNCTVMSGVIHYDGFTIDSTTDGTPNTSDYTFALFTLEGEGRGIVHKHIKVPPTPTPTTFGDLAIYSDLPNTPLSVTAYNAIINYINVVIAGLTNMATVATTAVKGATWMSAAPASAGHPISVENNDPIIQAVRQTFVLDSYGYTASGLTTAEAVIGSSDADLLLTRTLIISSGSYVVPANIRLVFAAGGAIVLTGTASLTIRSMVPPAAPRQIFFAGASASITLDNNATGGEIWLDWWAAPGTGTDSSHAIDQIQTSQSNGNPKVRAGRGTWLCSQWDLPTIGQIDGSGMWDGNGTRTGTVFEPYDHAATTYMIKVIEAFRGATLRNLTIYLGTSVNINAIVLEGHTPNSAKAAFKMERCSILAYGSGAVDLFKIHTLDISQWECTNINIVDNLFVGAANAKVFSIDTENSSLNIERNEFIVGAGATCIYLGTTGYTYIGKNQFGGVNANDSTANNATRTAALALQGNLVSGSPYLDLTSAVFEEGDIGRKITVGAFSSYITDLVLVAGRASRAVLMVNSSINATNQNITVDDIIPNTARAYTAINIAGSHTSLNVVGNVDEGFQYFIVHAGLQLAGPLNLRGNWVQGRILVNGSCNINSSGNNYLSQTFVEGDPSALIRLQSNGDFVANTSINMYNGTNVIVLAVARLWKARNGQINVKHERGFPETKYEETYELPVNIFDRALSYVSSLIPATASLLTVASAKLTGAGTAQKLIRWGRLHPTTKLFDYGYWLAYHYNSGKTLFQSNVNSVYKGYVFDGTVTAPLFVVPPQNEAPFTTDQNDYQPANIGGVYILGSTGYRKLTGWAYKPADPAVLDFDLADAYHDPAGKIIELTYSGSYGITLKHNDVGSLVRNRFLCDWGTDINLTDGDRVLLRYLASSGGWAVSRLSRSDKTQLLIADKDFQGTGTTPTNTSLSFNLCPGSYEIIATIPSSNVARSVSLDWNGGTATISTFAGGWQSGGTAASAMATVASPATAFSDSAVDTFSSTFTFRGGFTVTVGGTVVLRGAQRLAAASSTKILAGSTVKITPAKGM